MILVYLAACFTLTKLGRVFNVTMYFLYILKSVCLMIATVKASTKAKFHGGLKIDCLVSKVRCSPDSKS